MAVAARRGLVGVCLNLWPSFSQLHEIIGLGSVWHSRADRLKMKDLK